MRKEKIALIAAEWNAEIVQSGQDVFVAEMEKLGFNANQIDVIQAPGALEIPLIGQRLLCQDYDLAVGVSFIVNGLIYRHEFVAQAVVDGIVQTSLKTGKPFLSMCLTPQAYNEHSADNRDFFVNHMRIKGKEAANAAVTMLKLMTRD